MCASRAALAVVAFGRGARLARSAASATALAAAPACDGAWGGRWAVRGTPVVATSTPRALGTRHGRAGAPRARCYGVLPSPGHARVPQRPAHAPGTSRAHLACLPLKHAPAQPTRTSSSHATVGTGSAAAGAGAGVGAGVGAAGPCSLQYVMLLVRDVAASVEFYGPAGLGLPVVAASSAWAELGHGGHSANAGPRLALKAVDSVASTTTGYSPFLSFTVADLDDVLPRLLQLGAELDGPIKRPSMGKAAVLRAPDGHMISLFEEA